MLRNNYKDKENPNLRGWGFNIDEADVHEVYIPKEHSLNIGQVLPRDYNATETKTIIREMIDDLSFRMREEGKLTNVVGLYIGYSIEGGFARQMSLLTPTDNAEGDGGQS